MSRTLMPTDRPMLCVSIHDVAPATWADCLRLVQAVRAVADIPLTWLVVPHYHFRPEQSPAMEACLNVVLERGDELALHGYSHLDTEAGGGGLSARFLRNVYTRREGEFAALTESEARRRLELGLAWFAQRGWTPSGFVPPAWLLGEGAWRALRDAPFAYTTTFSHFHCLPGRRAGADAGDAVGPVAVARERDGMGREARPDAAPDMHDGGRGRSQDQDTRAYRAEAAASAQSGRGGSGNGMNSMGGVVQNGSGIVSGQGNGPGRGHLSGQGSQSRQFDARDWQGGAGSGSRSDSGNGAGFSSGNGHGIDSNSGNSSGSNAPGNGPRPLQEVPPGPDRSPGLQPDGHERHSPLILNNRRGTHAILSPSLVYAARNRSGRILSRHVADATAAMLAHSPLVRFSLHPPDARYPELVRHIQHVLERLLEGREAVTKAEFARRVACGLTSTDRASRPANSPDPSRSNPAHSAADRTSHPD